MTSLRVAAVQSVAQSGDIMTNVHAALHLLEAAAARGADLVVFPELFLCGYDLTFITVQPHAAAVTLDEEAIHLIRHQCRMLNVAAVVGACVRRSHGLTNSALVFDDSGTLTTVFDKVHLWARERELFMPGNTLSLFEHRGFIVGLGICYDGGFPEYSRKLTALGAQVLVYPAAFAQGDERRRYHLYWPMRALENTVYVVVANLVGDAAGVHFFGESAIFDATGRPMAMATASEIMAVADVSHEALQVARRELPYLECLRHDVYAVDE